ncbi:MAG: bifunctional 4-hydroxy-3-methylbut-2-enyl diphosphate reductase/30S ribosomal protein S1 [Oscillospiraceae bacterium]|nr:bifunctional 4-hydroxy-3-methylbut-2-enyl diphosphate reductase/30S ribosomal protein S1 [Oscillospiraceae bacterium]
MKSVTMAEHAGFCAGVARSVAMAEAALEEYGTVYCLGELVHNADEVARLEALGMVRLQSAAEAPQGAPVLLRAHGEGPAVYDALREKGAVIIDTTCGKVARVHELARRAAERGRTLVILGDPTHPEVRGVRAWAGNCAVAEDPEALEMLLSRPEWAEKAVDLVFQTTETENNFKKSEKISKKWCTNCEIFDTICFATQIRQSEALALARSRDAMVVIGGKNSANSRHLAGLCAEVCSYVAFVENAAELDLPSLAAFDTIGITAGASVPARIMKEVKQKMDELKEQKETLETASAEETEKSFEELLEDSIKTIYNGDVVKGIVAAITPTEVTVDLGTKHSGYIPVEEFEDDNGTKIEDLIHIGDTVEASVVRVNDVEGTVMLSKKRLDAVKNWDDIEAACENETIVEGIVTEENKGGVVVKVKGLRVFVPASQSGLPRDAEMSQLLKQKVQLYITEVNKARRRIVGSIRQVQAKARRAAIARIWEEIEVGKRYHGTVKSLTSYGAFVDIGGVDGMVHVSELSWKRITKPSDVVAVGDEIDVYVISFDKETRKISLGFKDPNENPWEKFTGTYQVGDIATVRVVKLMTFGAFAEIVPGVDGLIHISQIANRRIGKPDEVLTVGDEVNVKITAIDEEKHKVSLSIRALSEPAPAPARREKEPVEEEEDDRGAEPDALVYEVSETGQSKGIAPETDE